MIDGSAGNYIQQKITAAYCRDEDYVSGTLKIMIRSGSQLAFIQSAKRPNPAVKNVTFCHTRMKAYWKHDN